MEKKSVCFSSMATFKERCDLWGHLEKVNIQSLGLLSCLWQLKSHLTQINFI